MEAKKISDSALTMIQLMERADANLAGNVHGGVIMKLVDNAAGIVCARHSGRNAVTASIDRLDFHSPVFIGNLIRIHASINYVGKTSMEVGVRVEAEDVITSEVRHTGSAYLTYVSLDENLRPVELPPLIVETEAEKRRHAAAIERKASRMKERKAEKEYGDI